MRIKSRSKFQGYERMPNPALLATQEFLEGKIYFRKNEDDFFNKRSFTILSDSLSRFFFL
jgi:hypothetical protein